MKKPASIGNKRTNVISIPVPPDWHCFAMDFRLDFLVQEAGSSRLLKARIATKGLMMQILPAEVYGRGARAMVARVERDDLVKCFAACPDFTVKVHGTSAPSTLWLPRPISPKPSSATRRNGSLSLTGIGPARLGR